MARLDTISELFRRSTHRGIGNNPEILVGLPRKTHIILPDETTLLLVKSFD